MASLLELLYFEVWTEPWPQMLVELAICMSNEEGKLAVVVPGLCILYGSTRSNADTLLKSQHLFRK
jgi:hypothetical protein